MRILSAKNFFNSSRYVQFDEASVVMINDSRIGVDWLVFDNDGIEIGGKNPDVLREGRKMRS